MTSEDTDSATSLPGSGAGRSRSSGRGGKARPGRDRARASRSLTPARKGQTKTSGTCGLLFAPSSKSCSLQSALESRLRANLGGLGCVLYGLTSRNWDMPAGAPIFRQQASARHISVNATSGLVLGGWGSPMASDFKRIAPLTCAQKRADVAAGRGGVGAERLIGDTSETGGEEGAGVSVEAEQESVQSLCRAAWAGTHLIECADAKARPFKPGIFPLADGIPRCVVRLRGYGNAIVPQVGAIFVRSFMETGYA